MNNVPIFALNAHFSIHNYFILWHNVQAWCQGQGWGQKLLWQGKVQEGGQESRRRGGPVQSVSSVRCGEVKMF